MRALLILLALLSLVACGKGSDSSSAPKKIKLDRETIEAILGNQNFECPDSGCPEGMGRLFTINFNDANQSHTCAAFLISARHALTNSHCVYAGKIDLATTCDGIYFAFPTRMGGYETARCKKILWRDPRQNNQRRYRTGVKDIAIVELQDASYVTPMRINFARPAAGAAVYPTVMDQMNALNGKIIKISCNVKHASSQTGIVTMDNCPIISGNSGSPVLNEAGEVTAILFASNDLESRQPGRYSRTATYKGQGLAFSMAYVQELLREFNLP